MVKTSLPSLYEWWGMVSSSTTRKTSLKRSHLNMRTVATGGDWIWIKSKKDIHNNVKSQTMKSWLNIYALNWLNLLCKEGFNTRTYPTCAPPKASLNTPSLKPYRWWRMEASQTILRSRYISFWSSQSASRTERVSSVLGSFYQVIYSTDWRMCQ